ncbi:MAG: SPOR domain-containing protein [Polaromonas sp.]
MAFFNFRRSGSVPASAAGPVAQPESVEAMRKRAKHRLIGAVVLVLIGVVGFPLLFDTQPRPIAVDIPIEIPGKNSVKPLALPAPAAASVAAATPAPLAAPAPAEKVAAASSLSPKEEILSSKPDKVEEERAPVAIKKEAKPALKPEAVSASAAEPKVLDKPHSKPPLKAETKPATRPPGAADDGARAIALLNGTAQAQKPAKPAAAESGGRVVVQVGAFADSEKASEARTRLERAGLKTYTQVADTKDGKRTRVRVGPFASKAEAEQAVGKIRSLGLSAAVLTL